MLHAPAFPCDIHSAALPPGDLVLSGTAALVSDVLEQPDDRLDYLNAKIAFDALVDPDFDQDWVRAELDSLTASAWGLTRGDMRGAVRLGAVRSVIYDRGPWNDHRPFAYDMSDPLGQHLPNKLLHNYLRNRLGQCVSMPALFVILAVRLQLNVALASAPEHVFVRYTDDAGKIHNIEPANGGHPARDAWVREKFPISDRAVESGIYLRTLSKRESLCVLASTVVESLFADQRYQEAMDVAALLLRHNPLDVAALLWLGSAAGKLLDQLRKKYPEPGSMPLPILADAHALMESNRRCFARADQLGWQPFEGE
jgi:regulator of sirC expression with transglutaminase-like and TPR domain